MSQSCRPLRDVVAEIHDPRGAQGKRYRLDAVLLLVCVATLCGYRSYSAMAEWGTHYGSEILVLLGLTRGRGPSAATLCRILRVLDRRAVDRAFGMWAQEVWGALPRHVRRRAIAIDGKWLRGSARQGAPTPLLLSALAHGLGLTLTQYAVAEKTNEITAIQEVLRGLVLEGRVVTVDALLTQRAIARTIVRRGGHYVMIAKDNQPDLLHAITGLIATPVGIGGPVQHVRTRNRGHGRHEERVLEVRALLPGDLDWPGVRQVFRLERTRVRLTTGEVQRETTYGLTSLGFDQVDASTLLRDIREHWTIENRSHYVRDVTFGEDHSQVRCGATPQVLATIRAAMIGALRLAGHTNIAAATRHYAAQPAAALALLRLPGK